MLCCTDFVVLKAPFVEEVQHNLPVPATILFRVLDSGKSSPVFLRAFEAKGAAPTLPVITTPQLLDNRLLIPLSLPSGELVGVEISEVDPALLKKMAPSWLRELQTILLERLASLRLIYIDPETELFNRRAATLFLRESADAACGCFFLLHVSFQKRRVAAVFYKNKEIADLLPALTQGVCFSFGSGVFGVHCAGLDRERALKTCHVLQHQLKREGLHRVQIGFSLGLPQWGEPQTHFDKLWQALAVAERRGPFGLCDIAALTCGHSPFQALPADLNRTIRLMTRNRKAFFLAALFFHGEVGAADSNANWLGDVAQGQGTCLGQAERHAFLLLADKEEQVVRQIMARINRTCAERFGSEGVSIGIASWPFLDYTKQEVAANCLKALLHGSYLGPGSVVFFDHVSLNVSGDVYFEEGDYRSAIREYRRGLQRQPGDVNLLNSLGVALVECRQERRAAVCFREVLAREPHNYMALTNLGNVLLSLGEKSAAVACYERALQNAAESDAGKQELFLSTSRLYTDFGLHEKAVALLERWRRVEGSERDFRLFRLLGQNYMETGRGAEAMQACQQALRLFPQDGISLSLLGLLYVEHGQGVEVGLSLCRKALELDSLNADHWLCLGRALLHAQQLAEACKAFRRCLELRPSQTEAILQLGLTHLALGKTGLARRCLQRVLATNSCTQRQLELANARLAELTPTATA